MLPDCQHDQQPRRRVQPQRSLGQPRIAQHGSRQPQTDGMPQSIATLAGQLLSTRSTRQCNWFFPINSIHCLPVATSPATIRIMS